MNRDHSSQKLVVVIDDDALVLEGMEGLLSGWGYQVVAATSCELALIELKALGRRPDLIICDYLLSRGRLGAEAIDSVRRAFDIPAFVISGDASAQALEDEGHYLVFAKPVPPTVLQAAVRKAVNEGLASDD